MVRKKERVAVAEGQLGVFGVEASSSPPLSNRGVEFSPGCEASIDWVGFSFPRENIPAMVEHINYLWDSPERAERCAPSPGYLEVIAFASGCKISMHPERPEAFFQATGKAMGLLHLGMKVEVLLRGASVGAKATRVDVNVDDYERRIKPSDLLQWSQDGHLCFFKKFTAIGNGRVGAGYLVETFYAGSRGRSGSGAYFRCYDKAIETKGEINAIRFETEFTGKKACEVFESLVERAGTGLEELAKNLAGLVFGNIDFRVRRKGYRLRDCEQVPEWRELVESAYAARIAPKRRVTIFADTVTAFSRQFGGILASIDAQFQGGVINMVKLAIRDAESRGYASRNFPRRQKLSRTTLDERGVRLALRLGADDSRVTA